jgi:hypothetical protein
MNASEQSTFALGRFVFQLRSADRQFLDAVSRMLPRTESANKPDTAAQIIDLDAPFVSADLKTVDLIGQGPAIAIGCIMDKALRFHEEDVWFDAALIENDEGQLVVLAGASHSGKTTLALAMNMAAGWKLVSEDMILIDAGARKVIPFARPLGLRAGTVERIRAATNRTPETRHLLDCWYFDPEAYDLKPPRDAIAAALVLAPLNADEPGDLTLTKISVGECIRKFLPMSNLIHRPEALDVLDALLADARCFVVQGGDLKSRVEWLSKVI